MMPILTLALFSGAGAFVYVSWGSWLGGHQVDVALLRGVVGFVAMSALGFVAELAIATLRPAPRPVDQREPTPIRPLAAPPTAEERAASAAGETRRAA